MIARIYFIFESFLFIFIGIFCIVLVIYCFSLNRKTQQVIKTNEKYAEKIATIEKSLNYKDEKMEKVLKIKDVVKKDLKNNGLSATINSKDLLDVASYVIEYSSQYDVPVVLILSVIRTESFFNKKALSHAGAVGLMQLLPLTISECATELSIKRYNSYSIKENIQFGVWYLRKMMDKFPDDEESYIRAYNAGPVFVQKVKSGDYSSYPKETINYLTKVLEAKRLYESEGL